MKLNDICLDIPSNQTISFVKNGIINSTENSNNTLVFVDAWSPPLIYSVGASNLCGPIVKIIEEFSKRLGNKYVKIKILCYEIQYRIKYLSSVLSLKHLLLDAIQYSLTNSKVSLISFKCY